jgi:hypothetical protein
MDSLIIGLVPLAYLGMIFLITRVTFGSIPNLIKFHLPLFLFLIFQLPYPLRIMISSYAGYNELILNHLSYDEFLIYTSIYYAEFLLLFISYLVFYKVGVGRLTIKSNAKVPISLVRITNVNGFLYEKRIFFLMLIASSLAFGLVFRTSFVGDRGADLYAGTLEAIEDSRAGGGTAVFGVFTTFSWIVFLGMIERVSSRKALAIAFLMCSSIGLASGSKAGFFMNIFYLYLYLIASGRINFKSLHVLYGIPILIVSIVTGVAARNYLESSEINILGIADSFFKAFNRWHGFEMALTLMKNPQVYVDLFADFFAYTFYSIVPGFLWADKPLNPSFYLNDALGANSAKAVSTSWFGGVLLAFGSFGYIIGPIFIGYSFSLLSRWMVAARAKGLLFPLLFYFITAWVGMVGEGGLFKISLELLSLAFCYLIFMTFLILTYGRVPVSLRRL